MAVAVAAPVVFAAPIAELFNKRDKHIVIRNERKTIRTLCEKLCDFLRETTTYIFHARSTKRNAKNVKGFDVKEKPFAPFAKHFAIS